MSQVEAVQAMPDESLLAKYGLVPRRPQVIDSSMLRDYVNCPSMFYLAHVLGLRIKSPDRERQATLDWGTVWHRIMEVWAKTFDKGEALKAIDPWPSTVMPETDKNGRSKARMLRQFFDYVERFGDADQAEYEFLRAEQFFDVNDTEAGLRWCGRIDGIRRLRRNKRIVIWDYKTSSKMGDNYFDQHEYSFQLPGYVWVSQHIMTDPVEELKLDVMYTLKASHQFFRRTMHYPPARLREWRNNVMRWMELLMYDLDNHLYAPEAWRKNWDECTRYGRCAYANIHFAPPEGRSRLAIINTHYEAGRFWDPSRSGDDI